MSGYGRVHNNKNADTIHLLLVGEFMELVLRFLISNQIYYYLFSYFIKFQYQSLLPHVYLLDKFSFLFEEVVEDWSNDLICLALVEVSDYYQNLISKYQKMKKEKERERHCRLYHFNNIYWIVKLNYECVYNSILCSFKRTNAFTSISLDSTHFFHVYHFLLKTQP